MFSKSLSLNIEKFFLDFPYNFIHIHMYICVSLGIGSKTFSRLRGASDLKRG